MSEGRVRLLLEDERRGRARFALKRTRERGLEAAMTLLNQAHRGDPDTLQALTEPPIHYLFDSLWTARLLPFHDRTQLAARHLRRGDDGTRQSSLGLAELIQVPAPDVITPQMRKVVAVAASFGRHPLAKSAQAKILASGDQALVDEVCAWAIELPDLAPFCREYLLAPSDPRHRALFWLLTGQIDLYRAVDRSGALARAAYVAADGPLRDRLEQAGLRAGLVDLVRSFPGTRVPGDDDELCWEQVKRTPIAAGVELARQISETWQPAKDHERRLLAAFRSAPAELVAVTAEDPGLLALWRFESGALRVGMGRAHVAAFLEFPDGSHRMDVVDLLSGQVRWRRCVETVGLLRRLVPCSASAVVWVDDAGLWSCSPDGQVQLSREHKVQLVATAEGWAAVTATELLLGTDHGLLSRSVPLADLRLRGGRIPDLAVSGDGARLVLREDSKYFVVDRSGRPIAVRGLLPEPVTWATDPLAVPGADVVATHVPHMSELRLYNLRDHVRDWRAAVMEHLRRSLDDRRYCRLPLGKPLALLKPYGDDPCLQLLRVVSEVLGG